MHAKDAIITALTLSYNWNRMLAEDLRDNPLAFPTSNGGNHATWVVGHAIAARSALLSFITGEPNELAAWEKTLGGGSQPVSDASVYPSYLDLLERFEREHQRTLDTLERYSEASLDQKPAGLPPELSEDPDFRTVGHVFMFIGLHEMSHRGQLADCRRALGREKKGF